jgi:cobalt/nickel transport protein
VTAASTDAGAADTSWVRRSLAVVLLLVLLSPLFAWAAGTVGYAEPLENAAEATGAAEHERTLLSSPLPDYSVPGTASAVGTLVSGLVGAALTLLVALGVGRALRRLGS